MDTPAFRDSLRLPRTKRFGTFCFAGLLSNTGTWAQQVAQPWLLLSLGAPSFVVGLDSFALGAPVWLLTIVGGVLADRSTVAASSPCFSRSRCSARCSWSGCCSETPFGPGWWSRSR